MTIGDRIEARRKALGIVSQSALARMVPMNQSTLSGLIRNPYRWSPFLPGLARALQTTVAFLVGEIDDPDEGAPPPPPAPTVQHIMMSVALPSEAALTRMFAGMIDSMPGVARPDLARELAALLPSALGNIQGQLIERPSAPAETPPARLEDDGGARPARRRA